MQSILVVSGSGTGPTKTAAYDAALADMNLHDYNLVTISSVIPANASVEIDDQAPSLGPAGHQLWVVEAKAIGRRAVAAGLAWAKPGDGPGIIYEAAGEMTPGALQTELNEGLKAGMELRSMDTETVDRDHAIITASPPVSGYSCAVTAAIFGRGRPLM